jgi:hypothetical protein
VEIAFQLIALAVVVLGGTALAERVGFPAPLGLVVVGVVASYMPGVPTVHLSADVVLLGLLPPLLYSAAIQTSLVDFNANRRSILLLSVGLVVFTPSSPASPGGRRSRSAPSSRRRTPSRPPRSDAASGCHAGSSRSSRASRCSTTRPPW